MNNEEIANKFRERGELIDTLTQDAPGNRAAVLNKAFDDSGIRFHDRANALAKYQADHEVSFNEAGTPMTRYDSREVELSEALRQFALDHRDDAELMDRRTLPRNTEAGTPEVRCKADLGTTAQKIGFITQYGIEVFEQLPAKDEPVGEVKFQDDFRRLPTSEKLRILKADPDFLIKLPPRPSETHVAGAYINRQALDKLAKVRPGGKL